MLPIQVDDRDNDDGVSGDDVIDLESQDNVDNQEFSGEPGSAELETLAPEITEPATTTNAREYERSTLAQKTSTLAPEILTFTREITTLAPTSSTLSPKISTSVTEISTVPHEVKQNETTTKSSTEAIKPMDVIRLEKGDYEPSGIASGKYPGDDEEGSHGSSGEYSSSDGKQLILNELIIQVISASHLVRLDISFLEPPPPPPDLFLRHHWQGELVGEAYKKEVGLIYLLIK